MARSDAVWGVDIGNAALKAIRCRPAEDPEQIEAIAFDYIEYPKLLTQPGADPVELINDALKQFQSRNSVRGDSVAIAVPGQNGLARFIKLPPVETKQIPQIVRYEARQQIPFDLTDVIWDYQSLGGGGEEIEGFALETEVGLFAMKPRTGVPGIGALPSGGNRGRGRPIDAVGAVQLHRLRSFSADAPRGFRSGGPTGIDACAVDGHGRIRPGDHQRASRLAAEYPARRQPFHSRADQRVEADLRQGGTPETQRRHGGRPEGHLPGHAFGFQRSGYGDQRSVGYFTSINRSAKIGGMVALGSAMKLPGLRRYLAQNLGLEVERVDSYTCMVGPEVLSVPAFQENIGSFGVAYGLAVQALKKSALRTNLLPQELLKDRMIRDKSRGRSQPRRSCCSVAP